jgi:hypothetical protein
MFQNKRRPIVSEDAEETKPVSRKRGKPAWEQNDEAVVLAVADVLGDEVLAPLQALQKRVEQLEATQLKYVGVWRKGLSYLEGNLATHSGSMWLCLAPTDAAVPGKAPENWKLVVKKGAA